MGNPAIGIRGASYSTLLCYLLIAVLNLVAVTVSVPDRPSYLSAFAGPLLCSLVMGLAARAGFDLLSRWLSVRPAALLAILLAGAVYAALVLAAGVVRRRDLDVLPNGGKIADLLHIR